LTTDPSMRASEEPRIVAIRIHLRFVGAHGEAAGTEPICEQGGTT
jgi:hypothetical protein